MKITAKDTAVLVIDYQEKLMPAIHDSEKIISRSAMLLRGLAILGIPAVVTRQYPKGLGDTVAEIKSALGEHIVMDKTAFSCCEEEEIYAAVQALGRKYIIVCGAEMHICVLQTLLDLLAGGYYPVLAADCVGSRREFDCRMAIDRARDEGAIVTTAESALFELLERAGSDEFKAISKLVK